VYINAKANHESSDKRKSVEIGFIRLELIDKLGELFDVLRYGGGLLDVEQLAKNELMLVSAKTFVDQCTKRWPVNRSEMMIYRL
jgi:hypothetical protein